jgi:hypothetical protein
MRFKMGLYGALPHPPLSFCKRSSVQIVQNAFFSFFRMFVYWGFAPNPTLFLQKREAKMLIRILRIRA